MKHYEITIDGCTFDVAVLGDPMGDLVEVEVDGEVLAVQVRRAVNTAVAAAPATSSGQPRRIAAETRPAPGPAKARPLSTSTRVNAPLPGVVKRVAVQVGQQVTPGEILLVIEAMKMDNAIRATRGGVIEAVQAVEGRQVAHGDELVRYEV